MPGTAIRIADDGEVLVKGGIVLGSYWNNPAATAEELGGGWFATGPRGPRRRGLGEFRLIAGEFTEENGPLTPSLKVRRHAAAEVYEAEIEALHR